jgi:plastocyanin
VNLLDVSARRLAVCTLIMAAETLLGAAAPAALGAPEPARKGPPTVAIREFSFQPAVLQIAPGRRVVFVNRDPVRHDVTESGVFGTGPFRRGEAVAVRFTQRGVFPYRCTIHPYMHGKVVVR